MNPFVTVGVAVATGLAFLAYRHKAFYGRVVLGVEILSIVGLIAFIAFYEGYQRGVFFSMAQLDDPALSLKVLDRYGDFWPPVGLVVVGFTLLWVFLELLKLLPDPNNKRELPPDPS